MALILCPECHNQISDKAEQCPYCGLPAKYFLQEPSVKQDMTALLKEKCDYKNLGNVLISFDQDYTQLFSAEHYITHRDAAKIQNTYQYYYETLKASWYINMLKIMQGTYESISWRCNLFCVECTL